MKIKQVKAKRSYTKHKCETINYECNTTACLKRQRDELLKQHKLLLVRLDTAGLMISNLQTQIEKLTDKLEESTKSHNVSRSWILRKLGL